MTTIGFIGPGIMGRPMALNLIKAGYHLRVYARREEALTPLIAAGAYAATTPAEAAAQADVTIAIVSDTQDVEAVLLGDQGAIHGARSGSVLIDMSSISPVATRGFAQRLADRGVEMLDAPVSGGERGAIDATLSIMVGGKRAIFDRVRPILACLGKNIVYVGDHGAGQTAKVCNQIVVALTLIGVSEALVLARKAGVDPARVREALLGGFAASRILEVHGQRMIEGDFQPGFKAELHQKDMAIALRTAQELGVALPGSATAAQYLNALVGTGGGDLDSSAIVKIIERMAQISVHGD